MRERVLVLGSFVLAFCILGFFLISAFVQRASRPVLVQDEVVLAELDVDRVEPEVSEELEETVTSYQFGYDRGYRAFMEQQGLEVPVKKVARYMVEEGELDPEQASKGYVDGYHRAGDSVHCPRCERH